MFHRNAISLGLALCLASVPCLLASCSGATDKEARSDQEGATGIPRFPSTFVATDTALNTRENPQVGTPTGPGPSGGGNPAPGGTTSASQDGAPSTSQAETSGTTSSSDPSVNTWPQPEPGEAKFVGWTLFKISKADTGAFIVSQRRRTSADESQMTRLGNQRVVQPLGFGVGNISRRTCGVFDVSQVSNAVGAKFEFYIFAPSTASARVGAYQSPDSEEIVELRSLDRFTPEQILAAPFENKSDHSLDPLISDDLGDGELYARKTFTLDMVSDDKVTPSPTALPQHSLCSDVFSRACGRWVTFELTQKAVDDINASKGLWGFGMSLASVTYAKSTEPGIKNEHLFYGAHMDTSPDKTNIYPSHLRPKPRLVFEFAPSSEGGDAESGSTSSKTSTASSSSSASTTSTSAKAP